MLTDRETRTSSWVLAVDFGTSSTAAAIGRDGGAELVGVDGGLPRMLSNVFWQESTGRLLLGDVADQASAQAPWCFERSPKVKLGQQFMLLGDERVRVAEAVGAVIGRVAQDAIRLRGGEQPGMVRLTHPVRWGDEKRDALVEAAGVAGLENPELVLEPVAAAMHYASEVLAPGQHVAVYDLGGGTLDTAVLQRTNRGFEVVGEPRGRDGFGGEEFDHRLYRHLGSQLPEEEWLRLRTEPEEDGDSAWPKANRQFQRNVRRAKELLTHNPQVDVDVPSPVNRGLTLRVEELESLIRLDLEDSVRELERTIESAGLQPGQLASVYLAGGSSQIPLVSRLIHERLGVVPEHLNDAKAVICLGAALGQPAPRTAGRSTRTNGARTATDLAEATAGTEFAEVPTGATESATEFAEAPTGATEFAEVPTAATEFAEVPTGATESAEVPTGATESAEVPTAATDIAEVPTAATESAEVPTAATEIAVTHEQDAVDAGSSDGTQIAATRTHDETSGTRPQPTAVDDRGAGAATQALTAGTATGSRTKTPYIIGGVVAVIVVIVAVIVLAGGGTKTKQPTPPPTTASTPQQAATPHTASSGPLTITYPSVWSPATGAVVGAAALAGSAKPVALQSGKVSLAAGTLKASAAIPGGAPPQLVSEYGHPTSTTAATVAGAKGREYAWAPSGKRVEAYVVPTAGADLAVICQAPFDGASFSSCTQLAQTAKLSGVQTLAPGPITSFGAAVRSRLATVVTLRTKLHGLGGATLPPRAAHARALAVAETAAASALAGIDAPARYRHSASVLISALRDEGRQFTALAKAASGDHRAAYASAVTAVGKASDTLQAATGPFASYGFRLHGFGALHLDGPPAAAVTPPVTPTTSTPTFTPTTSTPTCTPTTPPAAPPPTPTTPQTCSGVCGTKGA